MGTHVDDHTPEAIDRTDPPFPPTTMTEDLRGQNQRASDRVQQQPTRTRAAGQLGRTLQRGRELCRGMSGDLDRAVLEIIGRHDEDIIAQWSDETFYEAIQRQRAATAARSEPAEVGASATLSFDTPHQDSIVEAAAQAIANVCRAEVISRETPDRKKTPITRHVTRRGY